MTGAAQLLLLCCLLQGGLCQNWASFMPQSLEGLSGSCLMIPCTFSINISFDQYLIDNCVAIWNTGGPFGQTVFNSGLTGQSTNGNILQGNLTGNLRAKNCTTVFHTMLPQDKNTYYFRVQCNNKLKYSFPTNATIITITDSLPKPAITPPPVEVEEGDPVRLECSAVAPCPLLPPALTWTPAIGDVEENQQSASVSSVLNFTASRLYNGQRLQCSAFYRRQAGHSDLQYENNLTLRILYPPNNTSVSHSGPVIEGTSVNLTCNTDANPAVDEFTWYKVDGGQVVAVGFHALLSTNVSEADSRFFCQVSNRYGSQNSSTTQIDVQFPPKGTTVIVQPDGPILEGVSVSLLCKSRANPPVTNYTWYKDDEEEEEEPGSSLNLGAVDPSHSGLYRCKARNDLGEDQSAAIQLDIQYPPKNTSVSVDPSGPVPDGSSVTLTCTSVANPAAANFSWFRVAGGEKELISSERDFTFNVTKLSHNQYVCKALNVHGDDDSELVSLDVTFAPQILPSSRCVSIGSLIRCDCNSQGNPPPSLFWELSGKAVDHSVIPTREVPLGSLVMWSQITVNYLDEDVLSLVCLSNNSVGSDRFVFNVSSTNTTPGLYPLSLLIGSLVGAIGTMLVCGLMLLFFFRKGKIRLPTKKRSQNNVVVADETSSSKVSVIYDNKAILEENEEESLHYASLDFAKLKDNSRGELGEEEVRGLASKTSEYAEVRLSSRGSN
uniref:myelin-associated glycoprotein-like isoform X1 n=1 Tax=Gasterosteus aculeatus aculeatus TaxID=481459 RepID=UPI001A99FDCA|nr:myelin-associated glycoprotein-like isoform X1 [Gasterosteus aculeatus aculeatus]